MNKIAEMKHNKTSEYVFTKRNKIMGALKSLYKERIEEIGFKRLFGAYGEKLYRVTERKCTTFAGV